MPCSSRCRRRRATRATCCAAANSSGVAAGDLVAGMQAAQVRDVAVLVLRIVLVFEPLLQLAVLPIWFGAICARFSQLGCEILVDAENLGAAMQLANRSRMI